MHKYIIELFEADTKKKSFFWRVKAKNGQIICHSETYTTKNMAMKTAKKLITVGGLNAYIKDHVG